ncbi:nucleotidyltransferase domain-containing protein [Clostridium formicaceticum]|uniref:Nucleotidyltransferase domain protein n=1 Tax=Clostridium formicaceticum TaxID=1497 RepID=A0AAC9WF09_9CLOT|nr:nucleotidyltransferase domain-containing protein [Clostridium formicaceticum]AOY75997.1 hypothetical protein BJL90_08860 [Clostridium formicaceticum]ARE86352.1 Nucleotidyltransferase domain protein [Clostridium formicaceticum]
MKYGLKESTLERILEIFSRYDKIEKVVLYGSRAKGNYKNGSDIDLALIGKNINLEDVNKLHLELDELYLPYGFDLSIFQKIENTDLINHIDRVGIVIYEKT